MSNSRDLQDRLFSANDFSRIAQLDPNLRLAQMAQMLVAESGRNIMVRTTPSDLRVGDKRALGVLDVPAGYHAIDAYDRRNSAWGIEGLIGTQGIDRNPALQDVLAGIGTLFAREGRSTLVCGESANPRCYIRAVKTGATWTDLTVEVSAAALAYLPGAKGYLTHQHNSNQLGFLPIEAAQQGRFHAQEWQSVSVPEVKTITGFAPRVQTARGVMIHVIGQDDRPASVSYNLEEIGAGRIEEEARMNTPAGLVFRGFRDGETGVVQNRTDRPLAEFNPGVNLVSLKELERAFGAPARQVIAASTSAA